jgi:ATP phosphoribosyltransferase regulatory subunit HisZ
MFFKNLKEQSSATLVKKYNLALHFLNFITGKGFSIVDFPLLEKLSASANQAEQYIARLGNDGQAFALRADFTKQITNLVEHFEVDELDKTIKFAYCGDVLKLSKPYKQKSLVSMCYGFEVLLGDKNLHNLNEHLEEMFEIAKYITGQGGKDVIVDLKPHIKTSLNLGQKSVKAISMLDFDNPELANNVDGNTLSLLKLSLNNEPDFVLSNIIEPLSCLDACVNFDLQQFTNTKNIVAKHFKHLVIDASQCFVQNNYNLFSFVICDKNTGAELAKGGLYDIYNKQAQKNITAMGVSFFADNMIN